MFYTPADRPYVWSAVSGHAGRETGDAGNQMKARMNEAFPAAPLRHYSMFSSWLRTRRFSELASRCIALVLFTAVPFAMAGPPAVSETLLTQRISFNEHIRPILSENCFACHGPDSGNREAGLRLDQPDPATAELDSGMRAIVPRGVDESELIARVISKDPDSVMPPSWAKLGRLSPEQVSLLERWIEEGAEYEPHWAFVAAKRPNARPVGVHPIDVIVAEKLEQRGLAIQNEADRTTLIRRASFDLTGLPPTPAEVESFTADSSRNAYGQLLERLLASPRYGERMAADWMDLARYSDSYGFQVDRPRPTMWPWRDWVIDAFNENMPWDQFALWQLAGDLLPGASNDQILATAFNRLHQQENEGGSIEEEYRVAYINDRVTTFGTAFLGLTLECCRCHDHKFDPLSQKDFYSLFAFFDDVDEAGLYSFFTSATPTPKLRLLNASMQTRLAAAEEAVGEAAIALATAENAARTAVQAWLKGQMKQPSTLTTPEGDHLYGELVHYNFDQRRKDGKFASLLDPPPAHKKKNTGKSEPHSKKQSKTDNEKESPDHAATSPRNNTLVPGRNGQAIKLTGDHPVRTPVGNFHRSEPFSISLWLQVPTPYERAVVFHRSQAWTDAASRGYELLVDNGHLRWSLIHFWPGDAISVRVTEPLSTGKWVHVAVSSDGSGRAAGLKVFINGHPAATDVIRDNLTREITGGGGDTITIGERMRDHGLKDGIVDDFRVFDRALSHLEIRDCFTPGSLTKTLAMGSDAESISSYYVAATDKNILSKRQALEGARRARDDLVEKLPEIMVMRELAEPKQAYVLNRGDYDKRGEPVSPATPEVLPPFPTDQPRNRLGLARWLIDPDHPLLARVTVNRIWQSLFGQGLVRSTEDLGNQATPPEYPELLDLLAWKFSHSEDEGGLDWNVKALLKFIMTSQVYRQQSLADAKTMTDDPLNTWLARGPRHRLPAEMIRDGLLAACGLLVEKQGGPPVKPYDLADSFKPEKPASGDALYRRSLYTYWRRSGPAPVLEAFDVPNRVVCVAKRDTTNTPLHAFVLLNGPQFVEAARALAESLLIEFPNDATTALADGFYRLTSRRPDTKEQGILKRMLSEQQDWYRNHPGEATKLLSVGQQPRNETLPEVETAALTAVFSGLLAHDESVVKQ